MAVFVPIAFAAALPAAATLAAVLLSRMESAASKEEEKKADVNQEAQSPRKLTFTLMSGQMIHGKFDRLVDTFTARSRVAEALGWPRQCVQLVVANSGTIIFDADPLPEAFANVVAVLNYEALQLALAELGTSLDVDLATDAPPAPVQAALSGSPDALRLYLLSGADPNEVDVARGCRTALHVAAAKGSDEMVRILLSANANVHAVDSKGLSALHFAAKFRALDATRSLLNAHADRNLVAISRLDCGSGKGQTATQMAVSTGDLNLIEVFTDHVQRHQAASMILP